MYHGIAGDSYVPRASRKKVKLMTENIKYLYEILSTLDMCYKTPEKYIREALLSF
jgi:hypothetical protein